MDQTAFSSYSAIFSTLSLSRATSPRQGWQRCTQPRQARHPDKRAPGEEVAISAASAPEPLSQPSFASHQAELPRVPWQGGLGRPDWLRQIRTELPGPGIKPVSPETHGHGDEGNSLKCGRRANEFGRGKPALNAYFGLH